MPSEIFRTDIIKEFEELRKTSLIFQSLTDNLNHGLVLITPDFHIADVNSKMLGWFPGIDANAGSFCYKSLFAHSNMPCTGCPLLTDLKKAEKNKNIIEVQSSKGLCSYKISCDPLRQRDGGVRGVLSIVEDITDRLTSRKKLSELEAQHMRIIENAGDAILTFNKQWDVLQVNKRAKDLFGYSEKEFKTKKLFSLIPENLREKQKNAVMQIFLEGRQTESNRVLEGQCLRKDGTTFPIEMTFSLQKTAESDAVTFIVRDISGRKKDERNLKTYAEELEREVKTRTEQLDHSEERYRSLVETASDAIISADRQGNIIYFNRKAEEIYGHGREEILGKNISEIAPQEICEMARLGFKKGAVHGKIIESYGIKKNRTTFPVEFTVSVFERDGKANLTLIARDITRRKNLEQELQEYTAKLEDKVKERTYELTASQQTLKEKVAELSILTEISEALSSAMDLESVLNIILVGATSHYGLGFNRAFLFLISDEDSYLEGKVAIGPSDSNEAQKIWGEILGKNLTLKEMLQSYIDKTGRVDTHVNDIVRSIRIPMSDENDILIKVVNRKESFNIKNAFRNPLIPKSLITVMNCNAFALVPLIAHDNVLGVLWADNAITKTKIEDIDLERLRSFAINASLAIEKSNLYENIKEKVIELDTANRELKENRDRLIRSEKLAAVGEMSATVAHGIRNPLVAIGGFARRLHKREKENSTKKKYLQIIVDEIDRLETLLSELLDFVRPRKLSLKKISLHKVTEHALQVFNFELEKREIKIVKSFASDLPPLKIDPDQFKRVLQNLFNNAMEAMPEGGILKIAAEREGSWVKISVADTGTGISEKNAEKVFHPFFTNKPTGTGLGLAVCNQIISIHGGHIKLRMQNPSGVIFDIYMPVSGQ